HTSWTKINEDYEAAVADFVEAILAPGNNLFLEDFAPFQRRISRLGALNALSQTLLKLTVPGVPDVYQGNDLWDLSLVDPDNRRPVDYALRKKLLSGLKASDALDVGSLLGDDTWKDGRSKLYLTWKVLELRHERPELFESGEYVPLEVTGEKADHVLAFARRRGPEVAITLATRLHAPLLTDEGPLLPPPETWTDTSIELPEDLTGMELRNVLTGASVSVEGPNLPVAGLLRNFPGALLAGRTRTASGGPP
ncbi:MAG: hypothetical protein WKF44_09405, partial [Rubrobacteraceae bacterium]